MQEMCREGSSTNTFQEHVVGASGRDNNSVTCGKRRERDIVKGLIYKSFWMTVGAGNVRAERGFAW